MPQQQRTSGNPILPGIGLCDPHVRICNEMGVTRNALFRDSSISYVDYFDDGLIKPIHITETGVSLPPEDG